MTRKAPRRKATPRPSSPRKTTSRTNPRRAPASPRPATITAPTPPDPTTDLALLALPSRFADAPDIPVDVARRELASLSRLARACALELAAVGIDAATIELAARFARVLGAKEKTWQQARTGVTMSAADRKHLAEAEALDAKLVAGGRWALRRDPQALAELSRIAEGSGLVDTLQDLRDLEVFWEQHADHLAHTRITAKDLARIPELVARLEPAAQKEAHDVAAARAQDLRNRAFWAAHELANDIREGGRYAFLGEPKLAARFTSRYRAAVVKRSRKKAVRNRATPAEAVVAPEATAAQ